MAVHDITQTDIELLHLPKILHIKAYLLDKETKATLDELSGYVTSGNGSNDANSDVRRTCNFTIHSYDSTYDLGWYNKFWLNQLVQIDLGFEFCGDIIYYTQGIYVFNHCNYTYDGSTKDLSFQCADLVSTIDGTHGGNIVGYCPHCSIPEDNIFIPLEKCEKHRGTIFPDKIKIEGCTLNEETGLYEGNDIKKTVEDLLEQNGITDYRIDTIGQVSCLQGYAKNWTQNRMETGTTQEETSKAERHGVDYLDEDHGTWHMIPYDLEFDKEATLWEVLVKIRDLYPGYEMFFDKDGTFVFQLIPICQHERDVLDHTQFEGLIISENIDYDLTTIKNATYVYGQSIETDRYSEDCSYVTTKYKSSTVTAISPIFDLQYVYESNSILGIKIPKITEGKENLESYLTINDKVYPLVERKAIVTEDENGDVSNVVEYKNIKYSKYNDTDMYCFKWLQSQQQWVYVGMWQVEGYGENNDENSPFAIDKIGYRPQIKSGGEYENITSSTLATERAEYENWLVSRLTDTTTLETVIIPFLDVNQKIQYRNSKGSIDSYIIKSLSSSYTEGTMTITMIKFYELDPFIVCS